LRSHIFCFDIPANENQRDKDHHMSVLFILDYGRNATLAIAVFKALGQLKRLLKDLQARKKHLAIAQCFLRI